MGISRLNKIMRAFILSATGTSGGKQSQTKLPTLMLFISIFDTFNMTESPAKHICNDCSSFMEIFLTTPVSPEGTIQTLSPILAEPASTLPAKEMAAVCCSLNTSDMENLSGLSIGLSCGLNLFMQSSSVNPPKTLFKSWFTCSSLYQLNHIN